MKLELAGKQFTLRCDMLALRDAKREGGVDINELDEDVVKVGTLVFYMARSGARFAEAPFKYDLDGFLGLISFGDMPHLMEAMTKAMAVPMQKKTQTPKA